MDGGDRKFYCGQYKGKTFDEILRDATSSRGSINLICLPMSNPWLSFVEGTYQSRPRKKGSAKKPQNPPLEQKCNICTEFTYFGTSTNYV